MLWIEETQQKDTADLIIWNFILGSTLAKTFNQNTKFGRAPALLYFWYLSRVICGMNEWMEVMEDTLQGERDHFGQCRQAGSQGMTNSLPKYIEKCCQ